MGDLPIAPQTYYDAKKRPPLARAIAEAELEPKIEKVHRDNHGVYGARKVWRQLNREAQGMSSVTRLCVERLAHGEDVVAEPLVHPISGFEQDFEGVQVEDDASDHS